MVKLGTKILNKQWKTYVQLRSPNAELITLLLYLLHVHKSILIFKDALPIIDNERVQTFSKKKDPSRNEAIHLITLNILIIDYYIQHVSSMIIILFTIVSADEKN